MSLNLSSGSLASRKRLAASARILLLAVNTWPALFLLTPAFGQTELNLATQSKNADFSGFPFTRTVTVGTAVPATCQIGQLFFETTAPSGQNLFGCTGVNVWAQLGGSNNYLTGLTGDVAASGSGTVSATLATVNGAPGLCGDATHVCQVTTNGKGLVTAQSAVAIAGAGNMIGVQNNGTLIGNVTTVNFGSGLMATLSGNTATITSSGSGGSGSTTTFANYLVTQSSGALVIQAGVTASVFPSASGTDVAYIYIDSSGNLDVGDSSVALACTGCTALTGISAFPAGSKPIAVWNLSGSTFTTAAQDFSRVGVPSSATSSCVAGQWAGGSLAGTNYLFLCVATNTWQRSAAFSTF